MNIHHKGLIAFRDALGIRPLVVGQKKNQAGDTAYMVASESCALTTCGYELVRDVAPGEMIYIDLNRQFISKQCVAHPKSYPCLYEYVACARVDSVMDKISVFAARQKVGQALAATNKKKWSLKHFDFIAASPLMSKEIVLSLSCMIGLPYIDIFGEVSKRSLQLMSTHPTMPIVTAAVKGQRVLLIGDIVIRGTYTSALIQALRTAGADSVHFASAMPKARFPNVYGIHMPHLTQMIAYGRKTAEISKMMGADDMVYQSLDDVVRALQSLGGNVDGLNPPFLMGFILRMILIKRI